MQEEGLDLRLYWRVFLKWWWVFVLGGIIAGVVAMLVTRGEIPVYQATAKVFVQGRQAAGLPTVTDVGASKTLADHYGDLIETRPIMRKVVEELSLPYGAEALAGRIGVSNTGSFILITGKDHDPQLVADIVNTTATTFIDDLRVRQISDLARFQASLSQYGIEQDPGVLVAAQMATLTTLSLMEEALPSASPIPSNRRQQILLGVVIGIAIAALFVFVLEYLDDSFKSPDDLKAVTGVITLGTVPMHKDAEREYPLIAPGKQDTLANPRREPYNYLRTNLEFAATETGKLSSLLVTSATPGEGKTTTALNLAISLALEDKSVILVDTDLRRPSAHRIFQISRQIGITQVVLGKNTLDEALIPTYVDNLHVLTTGPTPPDPTYILRADAINKVIEDLKSRADVVVFDSPPLLAVSDALILAPHVDGVVLVVEVRRTKRQAVKAAVESLKSSDSNLLGAVMNKISSSGGSYYYYYYDRYKYYSGEDRPEEHTNKFVTALKDFKRILKRPIDVIKS